MYIKLNIKQGRCAILKKLAIFDIDYTITKKERAIAREIIKEITYSAMAGIPIKNVRHK